MKTLTKLYCITFFAMLAFIFSFPTAINATTISADVFSFSTQKSLDYLKSSYENLDVGDELAAIALLRSGYIFPGDAPAQSYRTALMAHSESADAASQTTDQSVHQALTLAFFGEDFTQTAPMLSSALADISTDGSDIETVAMMLILYGPAGAMPPSEISTQSTALNLATARNPDGGFGFGGTSSVITTARVLQALSYYSGDETIDGVILNALSYLKDMQNAYGGFDLDGAPSPALTAEVSLALACLGEEKLEPSLPAPSDALLVFQNEDGSFSESPDSMPDDVLTAQAATALMATDFQKSGLSSFFLFKENFATDTESLQNSVSSTPVTSTDDASSLLQSIWPTITIPGLPALPTIWLIIAIGIVLVVIILMVIIKLIRKSSSSAAKSHLPKGSSKKMEKLERSAKKMPSQKHKSRKKRKW